MLKSLAKKILIISLELLLISGALWLIAEKKGIKNFDEVIPALEKGVLQTAQRVENVQAQAQAVPLPAPTSPVSRTFTWQYKGVKYSLNEILYQSFYDYYQAQPKTFSYSGNLPDNWEDQYYGMFLKNESGDQTIADLASDLGALGQKHGLNSDQIVDMTLAFVQAIPYDDAKAKDILAKDSGVTMRYPYEVLFQQLGVCSDKSLLADVILRQMGYGVALFAYEQDNHMAVGIECPQDSSTYGSGYCYAETTASGNKIGIIPSFDAASNKTVNVATLSNFDEGQAQQSNLQQLGQVTIFQKTTGRQYGEVAQTEKNMAETNQLKKNIDASLAQLQAQKTTVTNEESDLQNMRNDLESYQKANNVEKYNAQVGKYNDSLQTYQKDVKNYNSSVTLYNQTIARYNVLIQQ